MTVQRQITADKAGLVAHLRERAAEHRGTAGSAPTQRQAAYEKGIAEGLDLAARDVEATTFVASADERDLLSMPERTMPNALDATVRRYHDACRDVENACLSELCERTLRYFPSATGFTLNGYYGEDGYEIELLSVELADGTSIDATSDDAPWTDLEDETRGFMTWLETTTNDDYEGTTPVPFSQLPADNTPLRTTGTPKV